MLCRKFPRAAEQEYPAEPVLQARSGANTLSDLLPDVALI
jgi:hypothetical protein